MELAFSKFRSFGISGQQHSTNEHIYNINTSNEGQSLTFCDTKVTSHFFNTRKSDVVGRNISPILRLSN